MAKSKRVSLSFIAGRLKRLYAFGQEHEMYNNSGTLKLASICMKMIMFVLDLRANRDVARYLDETGGTFLDMVRRAVKEKIEKR